MTAPKDLGGLLPHRPPFLLVDRLISASEGQAEAERRVTADDPLLDGVLPGPLLVEALAQTAALMTGSAQGAHRGFLVALRGVELDGPVRAGDTLRLSARRIATLGGLHRVLGEARVDERVVARGELTFAVEPA